MEFYNKDIECPLRAKLYLLARHKMGINSRKKFQDKGIRFQQGCRGKTIVQNSVPGLHT